MEYGKQEKISLKKTELLQKLQKEISDEERQMLLENRISHISQYNRHILLEIMSMNEFLEGEVDSEQIILLKNALESYLGVYMMDAKEGWKWIILPCIYLRFIQNLPLHPQEIVHYVVKTENQVPVYFCPVKEETNGCVCSFCVCRSTFSGDKPM